MPRHRIPKRRQHLLDAARELALEQGWPSTTVSDIATRAGIGKGAVYLEFPNKSAILDALINRGLRTLSAGVHRRILAAGDVIDLPTIYRFAVESMLDDPLMRAFHLGDESVLGQHANNVNDERYRERYKWLAEYIARLQVAGVIAAEVDPLSVTRVLSVFTLGLVHAPGTLNEITEGQLRDSVRLFAELMGRGLATDLPVDIDATRQAQIGLIEHLESQLDLLEEN